MGLYWMKYYKISMYCSRDGLTTCKSGCMWVFWFVITTLYAFYIKEGVKSVRDIKMSIVA